MKMLIHTESDSIFSKSKVREKRRTWGRRNDKGEWKASHKKLILPEHKILIECDTLRCSDK